MYSYKTSGVCARTINFDIDDNGIMAAAMEIKQASRVW